MSNSRQLDIKYNKSGYVDTTAYEAMKNVQREERKQIVSQMQEIAKKYGYKIINRIELKALNSDEPKQ
jgi:hypothetical protein